MAMSEGGEIAAALIICFLIYLVSTIALAAAFRVSYDEVGLFVGPRILQFQWRGVAWRLNLIPLGSYVRFPVADFQAASWRQKASLALAGCGALFGTAMLCLGPSDAAAMTFHGFSMIVQGGLSPRLYGAELVHSAMEFARQHTFATTLGGVAAINAALNLLPATPLPCGTFVAICLRELGVGENTMLAISTVGLLLILSLTVCWIAAVAYAVM